MNLVDVLSYGFFDWCEATWLSSVIQNAQWYFAIIETLHIIALSILLGTMFLVDLRLLGYGLRKLTIAQVSSTMAPWMWGAFAGVVATGVPLFLSEAVRMGTNTAFFWKMVLLASALITHLTIHRRVTGGHAVEGSGVAKMAACISLFCWFGIALAGRAIAFVL